MIPPDRIRKLLKIFGSLTAAAAILIILIISIGVKGSLDKPILRLELARTCDEVKNIAGANGGPLAAAQYVDFGLIVGYAGVLVVAAMAAKWFALRWAKWLLLAGAILAVLAGLADFVENYRIVRALSPNSTECDIRPAGLAKWGILFGSLAAFSLPYVTNIHRRFPVMIACTAAGVLAALAGAFGLWAVLKGQFPLIDAAGTAFALALTAIYASMLWATRDKLQ